MRPKQHSIYAILFTSSLLCLARTSPGQANDSTVAFHVRMTTSVTVPRKRNIEQIRIWQALPTRKDWCKEIENVSFVPNIGERQLRDEDNSEHIFFRQKEGLEGGKTIEFKTQFSVISQDRNFNPKLSKTKWEDLPQPIANGKRDAQIIEFAKLLRKQESPAVAIELACKSISEQMTYDANVSYPSNDVAAIMKNKRGHCGHYYHLVKETCEALGMEVRVVRGMNLGVKDGVSGRLQSIRPDYTNVHTWAEVHFSKDGWIEVEPSRSANPFFIPARFISNNRWFQNYAIWIREDGKEMLHKWRHVDGKYVSDFNVSNTIEFRSEKILRNTTNTN